VKKCARWRSGSRPHFVPKYDTHFDRGYPSLKIDISVRLRTLGCVVVESDIVGSMKVA
jgi:hypothetical protein